VEKAFYRNYLHHIAKCCATVLNVFSKEVSSNNTKCGEKKLSLYETLERNDEIKLAMKFDQCVCTISLNLEMYFFEFPWRIVFGVISGN